MRPIRCLLVLATIILLQSCATIVGGSKYNASVIVKSHPEAEIFYQEAPRGHGSATLKINRNNANKLTIKVKEKNCQEQIYNFSSRTFRGWAFFGTIVGWTGLTPSGIPLPWGVVLDLATGALWKPTVDEKTILKTDYKNFVYVLEYDGCALK